MFFIRYSSLYTNKGFIYPCLVNDYHLINFGSGHASFIKTIYTAGHIFKPLYITGYFIFIDDAKCCGSTTNGRNKLPNTAGQFNQRLEYGRTESQCHFITRPEKNQSISGASFKG